jgi:hypothetical protein
MSHHYAATMNAWAKTAPAFWTVLLLVIMSDKYRFEIMQEWILTELYL